MLRMISTCEMVNTLLSRTIKDEGDRGFVAHLAHMARLGQITQISSEEADRLASLYEAHNRPLRLVE
jgi:hypothetical protein